MCCAGAFWPLRIGVGALAGIWRIGQPHFWATPLMIANPACQGAVLLKLYYSLHYEP